MRQITVQSIAVIILVAMNLLACPGYGDTVTTQYQWTDEAADDASQQQYNVAYLTVRNRTGSEDVSGFYGSERSRLRAGYCELLHRPIESLQPIANVAPFYIPDKFVSLEAIRTLEKPKFWNDIKQGIERGPSMLYVHGFAVGFERGCKRASLLQQSLDLEGRLIFFSWPSNGSVMDYLQDEADLYWSVDPLHGVLQEMIRHLGKGNINLAAHSLGARGVMLALVRLAQSSAGDAPLFNQVVLFAPDIDAGIFQQYLHLIRPLANRITIYVSSNDNPLSLSSQLHGYPRLGEAGDHLNGLSGIDIVDISAVPPRSPSGHVYHLRQDLVIRDLDQLINANRTAAQRSNLERTGVYSWRLLRKSKSSDE